MPTRPIQKRTKTWRIAVDESDNIFESAAEVPELQSEWSMRPRTFDDFIGQTTVKGNLDIYIKAARLRGDPLDHLLLSGLPGLGKTTLADIVAREMDSTIHTTSGPALDKPGDLAGMLTNLEKGDILFIDEIHRLPATVEEFLYSAMEDFALDIVLDNGPRGRSVRIGIEKFTLIGATTREGLLSAPFRDRFGVQEKLETYPPDQLKEICRRSSSILGVSLDDDGCDLLARHARGTPRIVNRFLRRVRDLAQVEGHESISKEVARRGLQMVGVDDQGLQKIDRQIMETIAMGMGRPVGLRTLAVTVGEDDRTVEDVYEPHLIRCGYLLKTQRGRLLTAHGYQVIEQAPPQPGSAGPGAHFPSHL
ncbi:MAG: Holliday junction DNA helicase RuvB [Planctomycetota bacterium]|jgi:Holliday junction DNA helicase RuvB